MAAPTGVSGLGRVLVIGATGILRPALESLVARGRPVLGIGRDAARLTALTRLGPLVSTSAVDATDADALGDVLAAVEAGIQAPLRLRAAVAYAPAMSSNSWSVLSEAVDGPVVAVLTSAVAGPRTVEPARDRVAFSPNELEALPGAPPVRLTRLVLGWTPDRRWHSPVEVSAAALDALDRAEQYGTHTAVLGRLRPWTDRPS